MAGGGIGGGEVISVEEQTWVHGPWNLLHKVYRPNGVIVCMGAMLNFLVLGTLYGWGNETVYVTSYLRRFDDELLYEDTLFVFGVASLGLSVGGLIAGIALDKHPNWLRPITIGSTISFCAAVMLASKATSLVALLMLMGVLRGLGLGGAHIGPVIVCQKWFPQNLATINGVIAAALGSGAFVFNFVVSAICNPDNESPADDGYFPPHGDVADRVPHMFLMTGSLYMVVGVLGAVLIVNPPKGYSGGSMKDFWRMLQEATGDHSVNAPSKVDKRLAAGSEELSDSLDKPEDEEAGEEDTVELLSSLDRFSNFTAKEALTTWHMYYLSFVFIIATLPGHVIIGTYKTFADRSVMDDEFLTVVGSFSSLGNGAGRIVFGLLGDRISCRWTLVVMMSVQTVIAASYGYDFVLESKGMFFAFTFIAYFLYGGNFAVFPTLTTQMFGIKHFGTVYGIVCMAWGLGGIGGDTLVKILSEALRTDPDDPDSIDSVPFFYVFSGLSVLGLLLSLFLRRPDHSKYTKSSTSEKESSSNYDTFNASGEVTVFSEEN